jgi:hypothetical protein
MQKYNRDPLEILIHAEENAIKAVKEYYGKAGDEREKKYMVRIIRDNEIRRLS